MYFLFFISNSKKIVQRNHVSVDIFFSTSTESWFYCFKGVSKKSYNEIMILLYFFSPQWNHNFVVLWKNITTKSWLYCVKGGSKKKLHQNRDFFVMSRLTKKNIQWNHGSVVHYTTKMRFHCVVEGVNNVQ